MVYYRDENIKFPKPLCQGMGRKEVTEFLSQELVRIRLTRQNAYSYWAHEVEFNGWLYGNTGTKRVDFVEFEPHEQHTATYAPNVERGIFSFYEIKSSMADIKSGHGLNFLGDENWVVIPVELYESFKNYDYTNGSDVHIVSSNPFQDAGCLLYGAARNGRPTFVEVPAWHQATRKRPAAEILFCMMRAMLSNSDHAAVNHKIKRNYDRQFE